MRQRNFTRKTFLLVILKFKFLLSNKFFFSLINNSPNVEDPDLRVGTNLFGEFETLGSYPVFFTI